MTDRVFEVRMSQVVRVRVSDAASDELADEIALEAARTVQDRVADSDTEVVEVTGLPEAEVEGYLDLEVLVDEDGDWHVKDEDETP